jgi:mono/diheme cytochrome c family protein
MRKGTFILVGTLFASAVFSAFGAAKAEPEKAAADTFAARCSICHGPDGKGSAVGKALGVKDWKDGKTISAMTDAQIERTIHQGVKSADGKQKMPAFATLSDREVKALRAYVRSLAR